MIKQKALNILIVPGIFPFPPNAGGRICIYGFIEYLQTKNNLHLLLLVNNKKQILLIEEYKRSLKNVTFHVVQYLPIELNLIFRIANKIKRIFKYFLNIFKKIEITNIYNNQNHTTPFMPQPEVFVRKFKDVLNATSFDIVQLELITMLNLINIIPENIKKIFVLIESRHSYLRDYGHTKKIDPVFIDHVCENAKILEYAYLSKCDAIFTLNKEDAEMIKKDLPLSKTFISPFPILDKDINLQMSENFKIQKLVFVGAETHFPNYDAMEWFISTILPNIKANIKLYIIGYWSKETKKVFRNFSKNIVFTGYIEDLSSFLVNSISVVPIRIGGGGMRTKILYSMANNTPVITTSLASLGFSEYGSNTMMIADTANEFIQKINTLIQDKNKCEELISNGKKFVIYNYSQKTLGNLRNKFYHEIINSS